MAKTGQQSRRQPETGSDNKSDSHKFEGKAGRLQNERAQRPQALPDLWPEVDHHGSDARPHDYNPTETAMMKAATISARRSMAAQKAGMYPSQMV